MKAGLIALLAGMACTSVQPSLGADTTTYREKVLYSFCSQQNCTDGQGPGGGVVAVNGLLYGVTGSGGEYGGTDCAYGCGTAFSVDPKTGAETVLYSFCRKRTCTDGADPEGSLLAVNGVLYGVTSGGGEYGGTNCPKGCGTVFSLDPGTGTEKILYSFCHDKGICADGAMPQGNLIEVNGILYGTSGGGGGACNDYGCGTVFGIDPGTGTETLLYAFCSQTNCADGEAPSGGLLAAKGKLYGTTEAGGPNSGCDTGNGCGTVFAIDLKTGAESVLYAFCGQSACTDGALPNGSLIDVMGTLYGTTSFGGVYPCQNRPPGCGAVFSLEPGTGTESVLHSFNGNNDGRFPLTGLIDKKGILYGTTALGGAEYAGEAFSYDLSTGAETVIWSFCGTNCAFPSGLVDVDGKLYGTLVLGGSNDGGAVFELRKSRQGRQP